MPIWNEQQLKAIHTKQKNILVSASAGSGKTTVLIARLIDLVMKDRISINRILAMTFTEAAANEMKKRLAFELHQLRLHTDDTEELAYITKQLSNIQTANISTIHSFCLSILQNYYYTVGLDGERVNNIMDNAQMELYQKEAMDITFEAEYKKQDDVFVKLCIMFSSRPENNQALCDAIKNLAQLASSKPDPDTWLRSLIIPYKNIASIHDFPNTIQDIFYDYLKTQVIIYEDYINRIHAILTNKYNDQTKKIDAIIKKISGIKALYDAVQNREYATFRTAFQGICHILPPTSPDKEDTLYNKLRKQIISLEDNMLDLLFEERVFIQDNENMAPYMERMIHMCQNYRRAYANIKEKQNVIDFDDMEHFALNILQVNDHAIAKVYREKFIEIMVDEFQDSNDVQNELVMLICRENNVFRVGDIKQSIYGFRHAKPQLMKGLIDHKGVQDEVIYLSNNYRSKQMIVEFNNELFKLLMNLDGFDCSYAKEDDVSTGVPSQLDDNVPIKFHVINHNSIKEDNQLIISKNDLKASYIANQIIAIKDNEQRKWKDFVVLVRGNALKDNLKAAFDEVNIPYFIDIKHGFYQSSAVQNVLSFLKACIQPYEEISFIAMLTSPFIRITVEEIAQVKLKKQERSYYEYFKELNERRLSPYFALRKSLYHLTLTEILNELYNIHDFYELHCSIQEKTNLDLLFEKAVQFEDKEAKGIGAFLSNIDLIKDAQTAEAIPIGMEEDVVRVMSIHQSKGLQFPVVFLWSNSNQIPIEFKELFISDADLGIGMKAMQLPERFVKTTVQRIAMEHKKNKEELEEEMRILYVATTRAQQQMHIVDCIKAREEYDEELTMAGVYARDGYTSWILKAFENRNHALFQIHPIASYWQTDVQAIEKAEHTPISKYRKSTSVTKVKTASASKSASLPMWNLQDTTTFTERGSKIHNMIELLPYPYTSQDIDIVADQIDFQISTQDRNALLQLAANAVFKQANTFENVYFELPFMVKDELEILHGYMDFVTISDHDIIIIDFKSDHLQQEETFVELYKNQLNMYQKAMQILYPNKKVKTYIYALSLHKAIQIEKRT